MERLFGCYLLHARPYRETSHLARIFHRDQGIIPVVAKGTAATRALQPFSPFSAKFGGRSALKSLVAPEEDGAPYLLSPSASMCALYANELILVSCAEQDAHPVLYHAYLQLMLRLTTGQNTEQQQVALRRFEQTLFTDIGYQLNYQTDTHNRMIDPRLYYNLGSDWTFIAGQQGKYTGADLLAIGRDDFTVSTTRHTARRLSRELIFRCCGKQLNSWKLFG